jgi:imidazolonepropionase
VKVEHVAYSDRLLLQHIGALHHRPGKAPLRQAWLLLQSGRVEALGEGTPPSCDALQRDLGGGIVLPAPLDSHTHLLFGGDRSDEFASRARGESYQARLAAGGGIHATVAATEMAHDDVLIRTALQRVQHAMHLGVAGIEVKSGYGLSIEGEERLIKILDRLRMLAPIPVFPTLLAHVPAKGSTAQALSKGFVERLIPKAAELGFGFDVFVEQGAYSVEEAEPMLAEAARRGMRIHVHADQLSASGAAGLAAAYGAASAEHLEHASQADLAAMAQAGVAANLLPGAWLQTGCGQRPPISAMREAGIRFAVSTDLNPGSSYLFDLVTAASLAISGFGLSVEEALAAITEVPATILRRPDQGHLEVGATARPWWLPLPSAAALFQRLGAPNRGLQFVATESV